MLPRLGGADVAAHEQRVGSHATPPTSVSTMTVVASQNSGGPSIRSPRDRVRSQLRGRVCTWPKS
jgi:hypothetical protein